MLTSRNIPIRRSDIARGVPSSSTQSPKPHVRWKQLVGGSRYRAGPVARLRLGGEQRVPATTGGAEWATANAHPARIDETGRTRSTRVRARATEHRARCERFCPPALSLTHVGEWSTIFHVYKAPPLHLFGN